MTEQEKAIHQFDDHLGLGLEQQKASLEAKHHDLLVHVPTTVNTVSDIGTGTKLLNGSNLQF